MAGNFSPLGSGPAGFVPDPQAHAASAPVKQDPKEQGKIKSNPDETEAQKPIADRFQSFMTEKWGDLRTAYVIFHMICWQNILFYVGELWIQWDQNRRIYQPAVPEDDYTPQPKVNSFAPAVDAVCSIFQVPDVECVPKNGKNDDVHGVCEIANVLAQEFKQRNGLYNSQDGKSTVGDRASQMFVLNGNIFGWVSKEQGPTLQRPIIDKQPMTGVRCPQCDTLQKVPPDDPMLQPPPSAPSDMLMGEQVQPPPSGPSCPTCAGPLQTYPTVNHVPRMDPLTQQPATQPILTWTAKFKLGNPLYALPRAGSTDMESSRYFLWAERMTLDEIYEEWQFEANPDNEYLDSMDSTWEIALNYYYTGYSNISSSTKDSALVYWGFVEPGKVKKIPEGGVGVIINGQLIKYYTWEEYCLAGHALSHAGYLDVPVTFFSRTPLFDVAEIQRELNRYESIIALHAMTQASDSVVIDENTKVNEITGRGDRLIYYRSIGPGSQPPHRMQHGSLDSGIYEQRQKLEDKIQSITGAVNVWRGQQAGSVTASAAISQLRGQAEQGFTKPLNNWANFWVENIRKGVKIMQQVLTPEEIAKIMGSGNLTKIMQFKAANLDDTCDFLASSHGLPRTRDERRNDLLALFDRQMLDVSDPDVQAEIVELFGETGMKQMFNKDATRARWENGQMDKGQQVQFMPEVEDLAVHAFIHAEHIKGLDFNELPPPIQQLELEHFLQTKQALTLMQQAAQAAAAGPGKGPNAKPAGQPQGGAPDGGPHRPPQGPKNLKKASATPGRPGPTNEVASPTGPSPVGGTGGGQ